MALLHEAALKVPIEELRSGWVLYQSRLQLPSKSWPELLAEFLEAFCVDYETPLLPGREMRKRLGECAGNSMKIIPREHGWAVITEEGVCLTLVYTDGYDWPPSTIYFHGDGEDEKLFMDELIRALQGFRKRRFGCEDEPSSKR